MAGVPEKQKVVILRALRDAGSPMGSSRIARAIQAYGIDLSPRTIRLYLEEMGRAGLVAEAVRGRCGGRTITPVGVREINEALVSERVGLTAVRMDALAWQMAFDPVARSGTIVLNITTVEESAYRLAIREMVPVFDARLGMGEYLALFLSGEQVGSFRVPSGKVGIGTVCTVTLNGVLLSARIPCVSRFGGVLAMEKGRPARFTDVIYYDGTSLDPLEIFIKGGLTSVRDVVRTGNGRIGASFREVPTNALDEVERVSRRLERAGLGGNLMVGKPNQPLLGFPVPEGRTGLIVAGGLNPAAAVEEAGMTTANFALSHLYEFGRLVHYRDVARQAGLTPGA